MRYLYQGNAENRVRHFGYAFCKGSGSGEKSGLFIAREI